MFGIFFALAEFERSLIRERTMAGLESARARGKKGERKPKISPAQEKQLLPLSSDKSIPLYGNLSYFWNHEADNIQILGPGKKSVHSS
ncbi:MAG: recombinase family protein [Leptospirillum sp.]